MKVRDVMSAEVAAVEPTTGLKAAARIMVHLGVSGLPVVDADHRLVGIITEADFLDREAARHGNDRDGLFSSLFGARREPDLDTELVGEVMTSPVVTIGADAVLTEAARLMRIRRVKRLPVVDDEGRLVGIVSRADVVASFVRPDPEIADEIREKVIRRILFLDPDEVRVTVEEGVATVEGTVETRTEALLLERFARRVDGVVRLVSLVDWKVDDSRRSSDVFRTPWGLTTG